MFDFLKKLLSNNGYQRPANSGVVDVPLKLSDYVVGANSPIKYLERLKDGYWPKYVWSEVKQWNVKNGKYYDNLGCTGNFLATCLETQWFFLTGQKRRISRKWINKMSGCNQGNLKGIGNYILSPIDWVRKNGWVWEEDYPTPVEWTTDEYFAPIPEPLNSKLLALAKENKKLLKPKGVKGDDCLEYEFLNPNDLEIDKHLKHTPLGCTIPGHQVCGIFSPNELTTYRDSYEPWDKTYPSKDFLYVIKVVIELNKIEAKLFGFSDSSELWVAYPMDSMQTLYKVKTKDLTWLDNYELNDTIIKLPTKKPTL